MKTIKNTVIKLIILILVFCGVIAGYFFLNHREPVSSAENLDTATLPIVTMHYGELEFNALHGYTSQMEAQYMRDVITPLESTRQLPITIYKYDNNIAGISYEVRSLDTTRLIESVDLEQWEVSETSAAATLDISPIPDKDTEYLLIIKLTTEKHGVIYYYTRIMEQTTCEIIQQLNYVNDFSRSTLDADSFENYIGNLEINPSRDNTNLADVDLTSSFNNLTWGNLTVERVSEPVVSVTEITGDTSCFLLKYKVRAKNSYDTYQYYDVTEFFRVKIGINTTYMYVYDRTLEQLFDPTTQNISSTRINLGLDSDLDVKYKSNKTGSFVSFIKNGSLWTMDMKQNRIISVFSFEDMEDGDLRMEYDQYDIDIISVDDDGNTLFLLYGYMEKGAHEGQVGVALYKYIYEDNTVKELVFIPSTKPYSLLKDSVGKFAYITENDILYFMIGDSIYTVTMDSNEYMQLATNLQSENYAINSDNTILAWHENTSVYSADTIRVIDVEGHKDYVITADEGEYIKVLGFIENDLIYGAAKASDVTTDSSGNTLFPMYKINIRLYDDSGDTDSSSATTSNTDSDNTNGSADIKLETYQKDGVYIKSVSVSNNILTLERLSRSEDGSFAAIEDDKLVNRTAENKALITIDTITTDLKKKELVLNFAYTVTSSNELMLVSTETFSFTSANKLRLNNGTVADNNYLVYAYGVLYDKFSDIRSAIECADKNYGMVVGPSGNIAWTKITKPDLAKLTDTATLVNKQYASLEAILADTDYEIYNLTGTSMANVLYFGAVDIPVITYIDNLGYVIISAYSSYLGVVDTFAFTSLSTGEITKMSYSEGVAKVQAAGNVFIVLKDVED